MTRSAQAPLGDGNRRPGSDLPAILGRLIGRFRPRPAQAATSRAARRLGRQTVAFAAKACSCRGFMEMIR
jgi:hypothetical protein